MKNSRNKIIGAVICGMITGSIGTSLIGNFQANNSSTVSAANVSGNSSQDSTNSQNFKRGDRPEGGKGGGHHKGAASLDSTESVDVSSGNYNDGTYTGSADGFSENLNVKVDISGGKISNIEIVSHNETPGFYEKAFESVPAEIIASQSTNVDTVSGATYSSVGIINAVNDALSAAKA